MHRALLDEEERRAANGTDDDAAAAGAEGSAAAASASGAASPSPPRARGFARTPGSPAYKPPPPRNIEPKTLLVVRTRSGSNSSHYDPHAAHSLASPSPASPYFALAAQPIDVPGHAATTTRAPPTPPRNGSNRQHARSSSSSQQAQAQAQGQGQAAHVLLTSSSLSSSSTARYQLHGGQSSSSLLSGLTPTARLQHPALYMQAPLSHVGTPIDATGGVGSPHPSPLGYSFPGGGTPGQSPSMGAAPALSLPPSIALTSISASQIPSVKDELRLLWRLSWPVAMALLFRVAMIVTDLAMLGHRSTHWLAAAAAAAIWLNISSAFLYRAFGASLNTLCSQAFGAGNFRLVGLWLQQALLFATLASVLVGVAWAFTGPILRAMYIEPDVADLAATFAHWSLIWLLPQVWMDLVQRYFQAQHILMPALVLNAVFVVVNALLNLLLLYGIPARWIPRAVSASLYEQGWDGLGFIGSPIATAISRWLMLLCYVAYCFGWRRFHSKTFRKWSLHRRGALHPARVRQYLLKQVLPASVGVCLEEWQLEVVAIFATKLGSSQIATHNATLELFFFLTSAMFGLVAAVQIRVGLYLGAGNGPAARQVGALGLKVSVAIGLLVGSLFVLCRAQIGKVYSSDPEIWAQAQRISILVGACYAALSVFYTAMAVLNGQARPLEVAVAYLVGCWAVCIPLSWALAFPLHQGLIGLWYGLCAGYAVVTVLVAWKAYHSDWDACVRAAQERVEKAKINLAKLASVDSEGSQEGAAGGAGAGPVLKQAKQSKARRRERRRQRRALQIATTTKTTTTVPAHARSGSACSDSTRLVGSVDEDPDSINGRPSASPVRASPHGGGSPRAALTILSATRGAHHQQQRRGSDAPGGGDGDSDDMDDGLSSGSSDSESDDDDDDDSGDSDDAWNAEELHYRDLQLRQQRTALAAAANRSDL